MTGAGMAVDTADVDNAPMSGQREERGSWRHAILAPMRNSGVLALATVTVSVIAVLFALVMSGRSHGSAQAESWSERSVVQLLAREVRSLDAARRVAAVGQAQREDGSWRVTVDDAQFHLSERNPVAVPDNDRARVLLYEPRMQLVPALQLLDLFRALLGLPLGVGLGVLLTRRRSAWSWR